MKIKSIAAISTAALIAVSLLCSCNNATPDVSAVSSEVPGESSAAPAQSPAEPDEEYSLPDYSMPEESYDLTKYHTFAEGEKPTGAVLVKAGTGTLAADVFAGNTDVTDIYIEDGITAVYDGAFAGCTALKTIRLPATLTSLAPAEKGGTFSGCTSLEVIYIPEKITGIPAECFLNCTSLSAVSLPEGLENIEINAFFDCSALEAIKLPDSLKGIGRSAFSGTSIRVLDLPDGLKVTWPLSVEAVFVTENSTAHLSIKENDPGMKNIIFK